MVELLWMSDQLVAGNSDNKHNTHDRQMSMPPVGLVPQSQQESDHRPRGNWDQMKQVWYFINFFVFKIHNNLI